MPAIFYANRDVTSSAFSPSAEVTLYALFCNKPRKQPGAWVIVENLAQTFWGKIGFSHDALLMLIGQKLAGVGSPSGLCYFNRSVREVTAGAAECLAAITGCA